MEYILLSFPVDMNKGTIGYSLTNTLILSLFMLYLHVRKGLIGI